MDKQAAPPPDILERVRTTIARHGMLEPEQRVLAAVSGGADSVALARALHRLGYAIEIAHLDHGTRGGASAVDAAFVAKFARELGVRCHVERRAIAEEASRSPESFEAYARAARYRFLIDTARKAGIGAVATGHHAGDQAETVLMRLLRGTGPEGLAGIPPVRLEPGVRIVRPLLDCTRDEIVAWLGGMGADWCEDASNADLGHDRNRVRHGLLKMLERDYNPRIREALARLAETQREELAYIDAECDALYRMWAAEGEGIDRGRFATMPVPLQRRCFRRFAWRLGAKPDYDRTVAGAEFVAHGPAGRRFDLGGGILIYNGRDTTVPASQDLDLQDASGEDPVAIALPGRSDALGHRFTTRIVERSEIGDPRVYCHAGRQVFDADAVGEQLFVRARRPGDTIAALGMIGSRKVTDLMINLGIPVPHRHRVPLLCGGDGEILWVVGHTTSRHSAVCDETRRVVEVCVVERLKGDGCRTRTRT